MLKVAGLAKSHRTEQGEVRALREVNFQVEQGELYVLLGPSGCGKTTTLRCVAGLERQDAGAVAIDGVTVASGRVQFVPPHERDIGMVFQSYAIWPHFDVFANVAYPLQARGGMSRAALEEKVMEALRLVEMAPMARRPATLLSGGQQQRVALARALVRRPKLLLLDEPLSNLDARLREQMREELRELVSRLGVTTLYVTHDQVEALALADRIGVMENGAIVQEGTPREIYAHPRSRFVADFLGAANFLEGAVTTLLPGGQALVRLDAEIGELVVNPAHEMFPGTRVIVTIRPEAIRLDSATEAAPNVLRGTADRITFLGALQECRIRVGNTTLRALTPCELRIEPGSRLAVRLHPESCVVLPPPDAADA